MPETPPKKKPVDAGKKSDYKSDVKNFFIRYYNSDAFRKNFQAGQKGWNNYDPKQVGSSLADWVSKAKVTSDKKAETAYDYRDNTINMGDPKAYGSQDEESAFAHEVSHVRDNMLLRSSPNNFFQMLNRNKLHQGILKRNIESGAKPGTPGYDKPTEGDRAFKSNVSDLSRDLGYNKNNYQDLKQRINANEYRLEGFNNITRKYQHDDAPSEVRGDINALRYLLAKNNIWDITDSKSGAFNADMLSKMYKLDVLNKLPTRNGWTEQPTKIPSSIKGVEEPKSPGMFLDRLRKRYNEQDIIWMINNIAKNEGKESTDV